MGFDEKVALNEIAQHLAVIAAAIESLDNTMDRIQQHTAVIAANQLSPRLQLAGMIAAGVLAKGFENGATDFAGEVIAWADALLAAEKESHAKAI